MFTTTSTGFGLLRLASSQSFSSSLSTLPSTFCLNLDSFNCAAEPSHSNVEKGMKNIKQVSQKPEILTLEKGISLIEVCNQVKASFLGYQTTVLTEVQVVLE